MAECRTTPLRIMAPRSIPVFLRPDSSIGEGGPPPVIDFDVVFLKASAIGFYVQDDHYPSCNQAPVTNFRVSGDGTNQGGSSCD